MIQAEDSPVEAAPASSDAETQAETQRLLREQRDQGVHSSQQKIKVVGLSQ